MDQGVGREVKRLREEKNWSMAKLAVEADMSVSGVSMIENGKRNLTTTTLAKIAKALEVEVAALFPKGQAPLPLEAKRLMDRPEVSEWLREQGHMPKEEFLIWAEDIELDTSDDGSLQATEGAIQELCQTRDRLVDALQKMPTRHRLFPIEADLPKEEVSKAILRQARKAWELGWEIRHEYLAREVALVNYGRRLFVEGKTSDYLVYGPPGEHDHERHQQMLEARRVLEESYARAVAV